LVKKDKIYIFRPKKISVDIGEKIVDFPLFSLVNQNRMSIQELEFEASMIEGNSEEEYKGVLDDVEFDQKMTDIVMSLGTEYDSKTKIKILFKSVEPPEGINRIIDSLNKNMD